MGDPLETLGVPADSTPSAAPPTQGNDPLSALGVPAEGAPPAAPPAPDYLTKTEDIIHSGIQGVGEAAGDIWGAVKRMVPGGPAETGALKTVWENLPPVQMIDQTKQILPVINAYEKARASGASISDAIKASDEVARQHVTNIDRLKPAVDAFRANPTKETARALTDAAALVASMFVGGEALAPEATAAEEAATAARVTRVNPFRARAAAAASKIEPVVEARAAKAGLAPGVVGVTPEAAAAQTAQSALEAKAATQTNVDQVLWNIANRHAVNYGVDAPSAAAPSRDVVSDVGQKIVDAGKADYQTLDKFTEGKFTNAQSELKNAQLELRSKAGLINVDTSALEANVLRAQMNVDNLFDTAVENGMPKETAEAARTKFRTGQATLDAGTAVRMANKARGAAGARTTDLNVLENRWTNLFDTGRLQQAFGEQGAKDALAAIQDARETGEITAALLPTERQALQELIQKNTTTGTFGVKTDWVKVQKDFSQMPDRAARFSDVPKVEKFINHRATMQRIIRGVRTAAKYAGLTGLGYEVARSTLE